MNIVQQIGRQRHDSLAEAIQAAGMTPPVHIAPGKWYRFAGVDKSSGNTAGYCRLFDDGEGGVFGDWSTGYSDTWFPDRDYSDQELAALQQKAAAARAQAEAERKAGHDEAAAKATKVWKKAKPATSHPYLEKKQVEAHGLRLHDDGRLIVPVQSPDGEIRSLQFIDDDGSKRFFPGGEITGNYHAIGKPAERFYIAEGYATAATVHAATGQPVAVAFNCGNLQPVAVAIRKKYPTVPIVVAADNDEKTQGNPGVRKATEAAQAVAGHVVAPDTVGDFNDFLIDQGLPAVTMALEPSGLTRRLADIEAQSIVWLWEGRLALGKLTIDAGDPGLGKSLITADITARITAGIPWPDGSGTPKPASVVFASAEDDAADTIRPRLEAAGADVRKVFILESVIDTDKEGLPVERAFSLKRDLIRLDQEIKRIGDVALVVVDPISAFLGDTDSHNNAEIRSLLSPLKDLASRHRIAVLAVSHLNKATGGNALYRVSGSLAFVAAARSAWVVVKDPDDEHRRLLLPSKNNLAPDIGGFAYRVGEVPTAVGNVPVIQWEPERVSVSAIEALTPDDERDAKAEACQLIIDCLNEGITDSKEILKSAREAGVAEKTLRRAKSSLGIRSERDGFGKAGKWRWRLPDANDGHPPIDDHSSPCPNVAAYAAYGEETTKTAKTANDHQRDNTSNEKSIKDGIDGQIEAQESKGINGRERWTV
ncbi:MAG: AAA family ATPase [Xanthomonadales bacterium]|nr:AAA family ATPase [Xanthomonadales bacterium]